MPIFLKSFTNNKMPWRSTLRTSSPRVASSTRIMHEVPHKKSSTIAKNNNNAIMESENSDCLRKLNGVECPIGNSNIKPTMTKSEVEEDYYRLSVVKQRECVIIHT